MTTENTTAIESPETRAGRACDAVEALYESAAAEYRTLRNKDDERADDLEHFFENLSDCRTTTQWFYSKLVETSDPEKKLELAERCESDLVFAEANADAFSAAL